MLVFFFQIQMDTALEDSLYYAQATVLMCLEEIRNLIGFPPICNQKPRFSPMNADQRLKQTQADIVLNVRPVNGQIGGPP